MQRTVTMRRCPTKHPQLNLPNKPNFEDKKGNLRSGGDAAVASAWALSRRSAAAGSTWRFKRACPVGCSAVSQQPLNASAAHFSVNEGQLMPLLSWTAHDNGRVPYLLSGRSFSYDRADNHWFNRLAITRKGDTVLDINVEDGTMHSLVEGKQMYHTWKVGERPKRLRPGLTVAAYALPDDVDVKKGRMVHVDAGGIKLCIMP